MNNFIVTGAAGFIGSELSKKLLEKGHRVVTIDNLSTGLKSNIPKGCKFIFGDCQNQKIYAKIPKLKYDAIFHIAGQSSAEVSLKTLYMTFRQIRSPHLGF